MNDLKGFIWEHREDDPVQLAMSAKKHPELPVSYIARQIDALGKIRKKVPSWYVPGLQFPVPLSLEQASSEATALFKSRLFGGAAMADLTGGLGVDSFFFSQSFAQVFFVEKETEILEAARHNLGVLGRNNIRFEGVSAERFLHDLGQPLDLIYLDPARRNDRKGKVFNLDDCSPNVLGIKDLLLEKSAGILLKTAPMLDLQQAVLSLKNVSKIWVVEFAGECREVLYLLERNLPDPGAAPIECVTLDAGGRAVQTFEFSWQEEQAAAVTFSPPLDYLYEPGPAIMKAGAFKSFATRFGLYKLHPNSQLYTSNALHPTPARRFRIEAVCKYEPQAVRKLIPEGRANISTRNFPDSTEQVRKKLGLGDGGDYYLFATTGMDGKKLILVCKKAV